MSVKYGNPSATYNIPLNTSENDIFRIGCAHLYHFLHINSITDDCKPMRLKMHLELDDSPLSIGEAEEGSIEHNNSNNGLRQSVQRHEEEMKVIKDALLQAKEDNIGLRQSVQQHEEEMKVLREALLQAMEDHVVNPNNGLGQSVQQLEVEMRALRDALLQAKEDDVVNRIDKAPDVDNKATQESNSNKQADNENKLNGDHNDTENVAKASEGHHTNGMPEAKPEVIDLRRNCVYIQSVEYSEYSLEQAFCNIRKLANEMNVEIPDDSVIHIDVQYNCRGGLDYYVYFCNADIKEEFLKNRHIYAYDPWTSPLRIFDHSYYGIVNIRKCKSLDLSLKTAYADVIKIVKKMGITLERELTDYIDHIDTFSTSEFITSYSIQFNNEFIRQKFLRRKNDMELFPETKNFEISDGGGHRLNVCNINNVVSVASVIVIGVAKLIGLSLATHNLKRIYVLHNFGLYHDIVVGFSLIVELFSKQVKDEFLEKIYKLEEKEHLKSIEISDINAEKNIILIKYKYGHVATAISFIGLAKQLQCSLNPDQIEYFFDLSKFIDDTKRSKDK